MRHIVLLGDSILDNGAYTEGGPDVVEQLQGLLGPDDRASLLAVDGSMTADIADQVGFISDDAAAFNHLALSVGGNDALRSIHILREEAPDVGTALARMGQIVDAFEAEYETALRSVMSLDLPVTVCTIYNGQFDAAYQPAVTAAVRLFNDAIVRVALKYGAAVLDLRSVCVTADDYANEIEPSSVGGEKIARAILAPRAKWAQPRVARSEIALGRAKEHFKDWPDGGRDYGEPEPKGWEDVLVAPNVHAERTCTGRGLELTPPNGQAFASFAAASSASRFARSALPSRWQNARSAYDHHAEPAPEERPVNQGWLRGFRGIGGVLHIDAFAP